MKKIWLMLICFGLTAGFSKAQSRDFYQIKIYSIENAQQEMRVDKFLKEAYLPALHRAGISRVGVFKPIEADETSDNLIFVWIPSKSLKQFGELGDILNDDKQFLADGKDYIDAKHDNAPYKRIESILLRAFKDMPAFGIPGHDTPVSERIYELRSYQGATEKLYEKKVEMFNEGGELKLFVDLGFNPVFFAEVISGSTMPNLMYMTTFSNEASHEKLWNSFRNSPVWKTLKADEQYNNTVSNSEKFLMHPTDYSDL